MDGQNDQPVLELDGGKMDVAGDVKNAVVQCPYLPPDGPACQQPRGKAADGVGVGRRMLGRPCAVHGAVRCLNAEIPQFSGLSHDPGDAVFSCGGHRCKNKNRASGLPAMLQAFCCRKC